MLFFRSGPYVTDICSEYPFNGGTTAMPRQLTVGTWSMARLNTILLSTLFVLGALSTEAQAHSSTGGIVMLLPTGYVIVAGAVTVAATFILTSLLPDRFATSLHGSVLRFPQMPNIPLSFVSLLFFLFLVFMVSAGLFGAADPTLNPLPHFIWSVFWVVLVLAHGLLGPLWRVFNPWTGPLALVRRALSIRVGIRPLMVLPERLGYGLAIVQFFAFAWFELVSLSPEDPKRLATVVALYWTVNLVGMIVCGEEPWKQRAEPFSILLDLIGRLAPLNLEQTAVGEGRVVLGWPGHRLFPVAPLPVSAILFVLLVLSTLSFDGLSSTFFWFGQLGLNPLDFQGRSTVVVSSTLGLMACFAVFVLVYFAIVWIGCRLAGVARTLPVAGVLIFSILPISLSFQFAHYLTLAMVGLQDFAVAISDPFSLGQDWFGTVNLRVTTSFLNDFDSVAMIFAAQAIAVTIGHVLAVLIGHAMIVDLIEDRRRKIRLEIPLGSLMVLFTIFGLWLLSTPRI